MREKHEAEGKSDEHEVIILSTVYASGVFTGWDRIIRWLDKKDNKKKTLHIDFMNGKEGFPRHVKKWSGRETGIKDLIENLFKKYGKKGHVTFDTMKRTQPKQNKIHG